MITLDDYADVVGEEKIKSLKKEAKPLKGKSVTHINSTYYGGGVAEMLSTLTLLMNDLGINTEWRLIRGTPDFFNVTKTIHNALQGEEVDLTRKDREIYNEVNQTNARLNHITDTDFIVVHDPQPLPLIDYHKKKQPWILRIHVDLSKPDESVWKYLQGYIKKYDRLIISNEAFIHGLKMPYDVVFPAIDPLSDKNKGVNKSTIRKLLNLHGVGDDKPIVSQVSRFDKWKDPVGVIEAFKIIKKKVDCKLVLMGSPATDDPEGETIYKEVFELAKRHKDIHILNFVDDTLVNVLQRASSVVFQKSLKEGFGLTVTEALWKKTPVVGGNVGGIKLQIENGVNGYLVDTPEEAAEKAIYLLENPKEAEKMGKKGHEIAKERYLITRLLEDYVRILKKHL